MNLQFIRTLKMRAETEGLEAAASKLKAVDAAHQSVARSAAGTEAATDRMAKSQKSLAQDLSALERRFDPLIRAQTEFERVERRAMAAAQANPALQAQANKVIADAAQHYDRMAAAAVASGKAVQGNTNVLISSAEGTRLARHELINLSRQIQDVGVGLASGQSPFTILVQQGSQIADVFASSRGTIGGFFSQLGSSVASVFTPMRVLAGGVVGIGAAALTAASSWGAAQLEITRSLQGIGRASGATVEDISRIGIQAASTFGLSISEATQAASAYAATGKIATTEIETLTRVTKDFAATLNMDVTDAVKVLAEAFADPVKGAEEMGRRLGGISPLIRSQIELYTQMNQRAEAQRVLVQAITPQLAEASKVTGFWATAWTGISNEASNAFSAFGKVMSSLTGIGEGEAEKLRKLREEYTLLLDAMNRPEAFGSKGGAARENALIEKANKIAQEMARLQAELGKNDLIKSANAFIELANKGQAFADKLDPTTAKMRELIAALNIFNEVAKSESRDLVLTAEQIQQWERGRDILQNYIATINELRAAQGGVSAETATRLQQMQSEAAMALQMSDAGRTAVQQQQFANQTRQQMIPLMEQERLITQQQITSLAQLTGGYQQAAQARMSSVQQSAAAAQLEASLVGQSVQVQEQLRFEFQAMQAIQNDLVQRYGAVGAAAIQSGNQQALAAQLARTAFEGIAAAQQRMIDAKARLDAASSGGNEAEIAAAQRAVEAIQQVIDQHMKRIDAANDAAKAAVKSFDQESAAAKSAASAMADANELNRQQTAIKEEGAQAERDAHQEAERAAQAGIQRVQQWNQAAGEFNRRWHRNKQLFEELAEKIKFTAGFWNTFDPDTGDLFQSRTSSTQMWQRDDGSFTQFNPAGYTSTIPPLGMGDYAQNELKFGKAGVSKTLVPANVGGMGDFATIITRPTAAGYEYLANKELTAAMEGGMGLDAAIERAFNAVIFERSSTRKEFAGVTPETSGVLNRLVQLAPEESRAGLIQKQIEAVAKTPPSLAREELLKQLNEQLKSLTEATSSLEDTMKFQLDPLFSQGHDYLNALRIGYYQNADGGVLGPSGRMKLMPLNRYEEGGIASSPQLAMFGEAGPEAFVPLKGGAIPVKMTNWERQTAAGNDNRKIVNNYINNNNDITITGGADTAQRRLTAKQAIQGFGRGATAAALASQ